MASRRWRRGLRGRRSPRGPVTILAPYTPGAGAAPDGCTLMMEANTFSMNPGLFRQVPYNPAGSFTPIIRLTTYGDPVLPVHTPCRWPPSGVRLARPRRAAACPGAAPECGENAWLRLPATQEQRVQGMTAVGGSSEDFATSAGPM